MYRTNLLLIFIAFISFNEYLSKTNAFRLFKLNGEKTILALADETITIECKADMPMGYCGFVHPSGNRYSIPDSQLMSGHCSLQIKATLNDTGEWTCHIGGKVTGVEAMQRILVRVVDPVAAIEQNVRGVHGKPVTIACATIATLTAVRYCRFEPPNGKPFSIDSSITYTNPILKRYYFPSNKSLDGGDCAVTIHKVTYEDAGIWTCGAGLYDGSEHIDQIRLDVEGLYTMTASATGITFGAIGIVAFLIALGFFAWKKRRFLGSIQIGSQQAEGHELEQLPQESLQRSSQGSPQRSPRGSPQRSPQGSPLLGSNVPRVIIQSPSEPSTSPLVQ